MKEFLGGGQGFAVQRAADEIDDAFGEMGEIAERLVLDGSSVAIGMAEQIGGVGLTLVLPLNSGHMHAACSSCHHAATVEERSCVSRAILDIYWLHLEGENQR